MDVVLLFCNKTGFEICLFFFPLDASLLSFPLFLFYVPYLSDLGGGRYSTDKSPHPLTHVLRHTHAKNTQNMTPVLSKPKSTWRTQTSHALLLPTRHTKQTCLVNSLSVLPRGLFPTLCLVSLFPHTFLLDFFNLLPKHLTGLCLFFGKLSHYHSLFVLI